MRGKNLQIRNERDTTSIFGPLATGDIFHVAPSGHTGSSSRPRSMVLLEGSFPKQTNIPDADETGMQQKTSKNPTT